MLADNPPTFLLASSDPALLAGLEPVLTALAAHVEVVLTAEAALASMTAHHIKTEPARSQRISDELSGYVDRDLSDFGNDQESQTDGQVAGAQRLVLQVKSVLQFDLHFQTGP